MNLGREFFHLAFPKIPPFNRSGLSAPANYPNLPAHSAIVKQMPENQIGQAQFRELNLSDRALPGDRTTRAPIE